MGKHRTRLSDQVRQAVVESGQSRYAIWRATGIDQGTLCRFVAGKCGMSLESLDALADHLDLSIVAGKRQQKGR